MRSEGVPALFHGYQATLYRDLPFSALQFMFWEQFRDWAVQYKQSRHLGTPLDFLTGAAAGGLAGVMTCPLDVVKTRLQTQLNPNAKADSTAKSSPKKVKSKGAVDPHITHATEKTKVKEAAKRAISTSSPSTHTPRPGATTLDTSSVIEGLKIIYKTEGLGGWFRGVGPRFMWTSIQSGCMLFLYQTLLRKMEVWLPPEEERKL